MKSWTRRLAWWSIVMAMAVLTAGAVLPPESPLAAAAFTVNNSGDLPDADTTDGQCLTASNNCTLRAALEEANVSSTGAVITFSGNMTITPGAPLPPLAGGGTVVSGVGHNITLDGSNAGYSPAGLHILSSANKIQRLTIRNWQNAIWIDGTSGAAQQNIIGTDGDGSNDSAERNVLVGNGDDGVWISGALASANVVAGNRLGSGSEPNQGGISISDGAHGNLIGTNGDGQADSAERNIVIGNSVNGISMTNGVHDNVIAGNYIGLDSNGLTMVANGQGMFLNVNANNNLIGTDGDGVADSDERNVISGNGQFGGITIQDSTGNVIAGNYIGTNAAGNAARGNLGRGIDLSQGADGNIVGTNGDGVGDDHEGNVISGNGSGIIGQGVVLIGVDNNLIAGNYIGTNAAGTSALGNHNEGVGIFGGENNIIGTNRDGVSDTLEGNLISGNGESGIFVRSSRNLINGNRIGTNAAGTGDLGNAGAGVWVFSSAEDASGNWIGGQTPERGNIVAFNDLNGVDIGFGGNGAADDPIIANSIFSNDGVGINLAMTYLNGGDGVTPNDSHDDDHGPNELLNFPELNAASTLASYTYVRVQITDGLPNAKLRLQFFSNTECDPSGHGEGRTLIGQKDVTTDSSGNLPLTFFSLLNPTALGAQITATATRIGSPTPRPLSTSEFSECVTVEKAPIVLVLADLRTRFFGGMEEKSGRLPGGALGFGGLTLLIGVALGGLWRLVRGRGGWMRPLLLGGAAGLASGVILMGAASFLPPVEMAEPAGPRPDEFAGPLLPADPGIGPDPAEEPVEEAEPTPTPTPPVGALSAPRFSTDSFYYEGSSCGPMTVDIEVTALDPQIRSVVMFYRLAEMDGSGRSDWDSRAMNPSSQGVFRQTIHSMGGDVPLGAFLKSYLQVQFVATGVQGDEVARSDVISEVMLLPCG
jgi:parallel beta-helix repeat protein